MTTRFSPIAVVFTALAITVLLGGCENLIQALNDLEPGTVQAGQGDYDGRIEVNWTEIVDSDGDEREADEYNVYREEWNRDTDIWVSSKEITAKTTIIDTSYTDTSAQNGVAYRYTVEARFPKSECFLPCENGVENEAIGYAMSADGLTVHTAESPDQDEQSFDSSVGDRWFEFTAQQGWTYKIEITSTDTGIDVEVYQRGDIVDAVHTDTAVGSTSFTVGETSVHHIRIPKGTESGTISVSY